ncbi:MAG: glycosyltransferase family 2 protein [Candidatus Omnitrophica bacterium]|nr:glycosyltransferase family 2 protein [Candidatus Omnitrophota bacterium]
MQNYRDKSKLLFSIVIPSRNEAGNLANTLNRAIQVLDKAAVPFEIIVVDDYSNDNTVEVLSRIAEHDRRVNLVKNIYAPGYGCAVRRGLEVFKGNLAAILMADSSDEPEDLIKYYDKIAEGYDCVFGTRFSKQSRIVHYPWHKLILNRLGNLFIQVIFCLPYNDTTNAFKCYSRRTIECISPLISGSFNLTVEMPLKAIIRGHKWCVVPVNWYGRKKGVSKWGIKEIGAGYLSTIFCLWMEKLSSRADRPERAL